MKSNQKLSQYEDRNKCLSFPSAEPSLISVSETNGPTSLSHLTWKCQYIPLETCKSEHNIILHNIWRYFGFAEAENVKKILLKWLKINRKIIKFLVQQWEFWLFYYLHTWQYFTQNMIFIHLPVGGREKNIST